MPPLLTLVSGRYRGRRNGFEVELRVDIDGPRPMHRASADYFRVQRGKLEYFGSMRVDAPAVTPSPSQVTISGVARSTWETNASFVRVTIPRVRQGASPASATLSHLTPGGQRRALYECAYTSPSFRTVLLEEDSEVGIECFKSYDTGLLPAPCERRTLTHLSAFDEAGIEMVRTREPGMIASSGASWSDAELHAAMVKHFAGFADVPQWAVWLLHARLHDRDRTSPRESVVGLMFDRRGRQRQGCAVFYRAIEAMEEAGPQQLRTQLFACVHEIAHSFNLLHCFQKSLAIPPVPSRPRSATWMAYPQLFPGGADAFWSQFAFRFDDAELVHLRHAMRDSIIMGGDPFLAGAAFEHDAHETTTQPEDPGLRLALAAPPVVRYGVPVTVEFALSGTTKEGRAAPSVLGPRPGNVDIAIRRPDGVTQVFEPLLRHCRVGDAVVLRAGDAPVRDSAFIHYGKDGFVFDRPGRYEIAARCMAPNGSLVLSNIARTVVRRPATRADEDVAGLMFDDQQGELMSLVGSDAPELRRGNDALEAIVERHPRHPLASVARIVQATNAARQFKAVQQDGSVRMRKPDPQEAATILRGTGTLEALQRTVRAANEAMILRQLARVPVAPSTAPADLYIRSRANEIALVLPDVLAAASAEHHAQRNRSARVR